MPPGGWRRRPSFIDDSPALSVLEARAKARRMKAEHGLDMIVIDYLQLMRGRNPENRQQEISEISRSLKALAKELDVPVVASRSCHGRWRAVRARSRSSLTCANRARSSRTPT